MNIYFNYININSTKYQFHKQMANHFSINSIITVQLDYEFYERRGTMNKVCGRTTDSGFVSSINIHLKSE